MENRKITAVVIVGVMFASAAAGGYFLIAKPKLPKLAISFSNSSASEDPTLSFQPSTSSPIVGDTFTVDINIDNGSQRASAVELHVDLPANLQAISIQKGSFPMPTELVPGSVSGNHASITLGSNPADPRPGVGVLAVLTVKAISAGSALLQFDPSTKIAVIGETGNTVGGLEPTTINISGPTPTPPTGPAVQGGIDSADCNTITGWAADTNAPNTPVTVEILRDRSYQGGGQQVFDGPTDIDRSDVNDRLHISGTHGFSWPIPDSLKDGNYHDLFLYITNGDGNYTRLTWNGNSTPSINCSAPPTQQANRPTGFIDGVNSDGSAINGWAFDPGISNQPIEVYMGFYRKVFPGVYTFVATVRQTTNLVRQDVNSTYGISGPHGFKYPIYFIPDQFKDGKDYKIDMTIADGRSGTHLNGGPVYLSAAQIRNAPAPDPNKYDGVVQEIQFGIDDLSSAVQKAINAGLIVAKTEGDPEITAIYDPDIPGQLLLTIIAQNELKGPADINKTFSICSDGGDNTYHLLLGKPLAINGGTNLLNVSCDDTEPLCAKIKTLTKNTGNTMNNFVGKLNINAPTLQYINTTINPQVLAGMGGVQVKIGNYFPDTDLAAVALTSISKVGQPYAVVLVNRSIAEHLDNTSMQEVLEHELLHTMGIGHSFKFGSLMYPEYNPNNQGLNTDIATDLQRIYGNNPYELKQANCENVSKTTPNSQILDFLNTDASDVSGWDVSDFLTRFFFDRILTSPPPGDVTPEVGTCWQVDEHLTCD